MSAEGLAPPGLSHGAHLFKKGNPGPDSGPGGGAHPSPSLSISPPLRRGAGWRGRKVLLKASLLLSIRVNQILSRPSQLAAFGSRLFQRLRSFDLYSHWTGLSSAGNSLLLCCQHSAHPLPSKKAALLDLPRGSRSPWLALAAWSLGLQQQVTSLPRQGLFRVLSCHSGTHPEGHCPELPVGIRKGLALG